MGVSNLKPRPLPVSEIPNFENRLFRGHFEVTWGAPWGEIWKSGSVSTPALSTSTDVGGNLEIYRRVWPLSVAPFALRKNSEIFKNSWGDPPTPHPPHLRRGHRGRRGLQGKNKIRPRPLPVSPEIEVKVFRLTPRSSAPLTPGGSNFGDVIEDPYLYRVTKFGRKLLCGGGAAAV